ncbi:MAG: hypothetical protein ACOZIN_21365 [Myxococcota bacterium]
MIALPRVGDARAIVGGIQPPISIGIAARGAPAIYLPAINTAVALASTVGWSSWPNQDDASSA